MTRATESIRPRVLVCGAGPDDANHNAILRADVVDGFVEVLGPQAVLSMRYEAAARIVRRDRPELVLMFGSCLPDSCEYASVRKACDEVQARLVFWLHDDPYEFDAHVKVADLADVLFSNDRFAALHYPRGKARHLPLAANPRRFGEICSIPWGERRRDLFFCGVCFPNRQQMIEDLAVTLNRYATEILGSEWPAARFRFCRNERINPASLPAEYAASRVVLNIGRTLNLANERYQLDPSTPGPRTFEAAMAGSCQLLFADSLEVLDYFELGQEILLFNNPDDFSEQLEALLTDGERAMAIGAAARRRALVDHTYAARARQILAAVSMLPTEATAAAPVAAPADPSYLAPHFAMAR